jgi:hypothetical protein
MLFHLHFPVTVCLVHLITIMRSLTKAGCIKLQFIAFLQIMLLSVGINHNSTIFTRSSFKIFVSFVQLLFIRYSFITLMAFFKENDAILSKSFEMSPLSIAIHKSHLNIFSDHDAIFVDKHLSDFRIFCQIFSNEWV